MAEEIAVLPGMEEISALLYINQYVREKTYDLMILDCAPTAESMRFVSVPSALEWYMKKVFKLERTVFKVARPIAARLTDVPLPGDDYFANLELLFQKLEGVDRLLTDHESTTVRLVCNPEKMVLKESQRAYTYFSLYGLAVEAVIMNRVWPAGGPGPGPASWPSCSSSIWPMAGSTSLPCPSCRWSRSSTRCWATARLLELGRELYGDDRPVGNISTTASRSALRKTTASSRVRLHLPSAGKGPPQSAQGGRRAGGGGGGVPQAPGPAPQLRPGPPRAKAKFP